MGTPTLWVKKLIQKIKLCPMGFQYLSKTPTSNFMRISQSQWHWIFINVLILMNSAYLMSLLPFRAILNKRRKVHIAMSLVLRLATVQWMLLYQSHCFIPLFKALLDGLYNMIVYVLPVKNTNDLTLKKKLSRLK